jgi:hypothetical protein
MFSFGATAAAQSDCAAELTIRVRTTVTTFSNINAAGPSASSEQYVPFHYWWKYKAKVREIIGGKYSERSISFAHLQPGQYRASLTRNWVVALGRCQPDLAKSLEVEWCVVGHALANDAAGRGRLTSESRLTPNTSCMDSSGK